MALLLRATPLNRHVLIGTLAAALAAIGFSGKAILVKLAYASPVDAVTLLAIRMAFSLPFFIAAALWSRRYQRVAALTRRDAFAILVLGLLGYYLSSLLDFSGLQYISAGLERLVLFLYPTLVVLLSALLFKRRIGRHELLALGLSYAGILLVFVHDAHTQTGGLVLGAALVFASTLTYSVYLIGAGQTIARVGAIRFTAYAMLVASVATLLQFALTHPLSALALPSRVYGLGVLMAIFSTVLPVFLLSYAIRRIGPGHTALVGSIGPVATIFLAYVFLGEPVSAAQIAGAALVLAGVLAINAKPAAPAVPG
jgi:drug/metabolite transporter (DMT)-like permease